MSYTLREMMQADPFRELQVIAGAGGLDNEVRYVGVLEAPDSVNYVKEHEFVLTTGYIFADNTKQLLDIMLQLHKRNAAALGIKVFRYIQTLPEEARQLADECGLPIFFIPNKYSWHELILPMIFHISAMSAEEGVFYQDYHQLIYGMQHSQTIYDFISRTGELLQRPVTLLNKQTMDAMHYPSDYRPLQEDNLCWQEMLEDEHAKVLQNGKIRYYHREEERLRLLVAELQMPEYQYLILWDCPEPGDLNRFNYLVYSLMLVSEFLQNRREMQKNLMLQKGLSLYQVFMESKSERYTAGIPGVNFDRHREYSPVLVIFEDAGGMAEERITVYNPVVVRLLELLHQKWEIHGFTDREGRMHLLIPLGDSAASAQRHIAAGRKISAAVQKSIQKYFPDLTNHIITGRFGGGLEKLLKCHRELLNTVEFLQTQEKEDLPALLHIHDLGLNVFFSYPEVRGFLDDFLKDYFESVEALEPEGREKLLEASRGYVASGFNTREAARALGVHHNTIRNRMEQLLSLTGLDLKRSEDLLIFLVYMQTISGK